MTEATETSAESGIQLTGLIGWIIVCFSAAAVGASFPVDDWYEGLNRPPFAPPNVIFGPVWTMLYLAMSVAAWLVWRRGGIRRNLLRVSTFVIQLILNGGWSWLFFGLHRIDLALIDIGLLWVAIVVTIIMFFPRNRIAGWLLVPYLAWVSFAAVLNLEFWRLNR